MRNLRWVVALLLLIPSLAFAQNQRIRVDFVRVSPTGDLTEEGVKLELDDANGARFGWEFLFSDQFGLELAVSSAKHDVVGSAGALKLTIGDVKVRPVTASLLFHLTPEARADFYLGGGLAYVDYGDVRLEFPGEPAESFSVDADTTWMAQLGFDVPIGDAIGMTFGVVYIDTEAKAEDGSALPVKPWIGRGGVLFRF